MSRRPSVEVEANSVDEAIVKALTELRVPKDKASIEVLDEGKPKTLGLFGGRKARVRATLKSGVTPDGLGRPERGDRGPRPDRPERTDRAPRADRGDRGPRPERGDRPDRGERGGRGGRDRDRAARPDRGDRPDRVDRPERADRPERMERADRPEPMDRPDRGDRTERDAQPHTPPAPVGVRMELVRERAGELLRLMGVENPMNAELRNGEVWLSVESGAADAILIGRRGETLSALEHLLTRMSSLHERDRLKVILDVAGYRSRRQNRDEASGEEGDSDAAVSMAEDDDDEPMAPRSYDRETADAGMADDEEPSEPAEVMAEAPRANGSTHWTPPVVDEDDEDAAPSAELGGERPRERDRGRDRDRGGRGGRDRDRRGGRGGRDRDRDRDRSYPPVEVTPQMEAEMREHKRLEQEIIARSAVGPAVPEVPKDVPPGPKLPSFRPPARPKRRGYTPNEPR